MMPNKDPEVRRAYHREYMARRYKDDPKFRAAHKRKVKASDRKRLERVKQLVAEFRSKGCLTCPESDPCCLVAHHVDPTTKKFNIGHQMKEMSFSVAVRELAKCVCLCMNCHSKLHAGKISLRPSGGEGLS